MKLKNSEILGFNNIYNEAFVNESRYFPANVTFYLYKNLHELSNSLESIDESRNNIIKHFGKINEETGEVSVEPDKIEKVNKELALLLDLEQEVNLFKIPLSWLSDIEFTPKQMQLLWCMIDETL